MSAMRCQREFTEEQIGQIREEAADFFAQTGSLEGPFVSKTLFFSILLALFTAIPDYNIFDILGKYNKKEENEDKKEENEEENAEEKEIDPILKYENRYQDLINIKKTGFKAVKLADRIKNKSEYYEKCFKIRSEFQNAAYDWHSLSSSTAKFMYDREMLKISVEQKEKYGIGEINCPVCNTKWLKEPNSECLKCNREERVKLFVAIAHFFQVVTDMESFWAVLDKETKEKLFDPKKCQQYLEYFRKKQDNRKSRLNKIWYKEYGMNQYKKLVKEKGFDEIDADEELKEFNRKYGLALTRLDEEIDLREAKNTFQISFVEDLSLLEFIIAKKVIFPEKKVDLNAFKPKMPCLIEIVAKKCQIKQLELDVKFFPSLRRINLEDNKIEELIDIRNLANLPKLKKIWLQGNPIEQTREIYKTDNSFRRNKIEIMYDPEIKYRRMGDIEKESDIEIRTTMMKFPDLYEEDESEASLSLSDLSETTKKEKLKEQKKINKILKKY